MRFRARYLVLVVALTPLVEGRGQTPTDPSASSPELLCLKQNEPVIAVCFSLDGRRIIASGQNQAIRQFDRDGHELAPMKNAPGGWWAAYSPDGRLFLSCGLDRMVRIWDADTGSERKPFCGHGQTAWVAAFLPGSRCVSVGEDGTIRFWNPETTKEMGQIHGHPGPVWTMAVSPDGRLLATGGSDGGVRLWDLASGRLKRVCEANHTGGVWPLVFAPDGRTLASGGWQDHTVRLWEVATGKLRRTFTHPGGLKSVAFTADGHALITAGSDPSIRFWDLPGGAELPAFDGHRGMVNAIAVSPDGEVLASAGSDGTVRLWDLKARRTAAKPARELPAKEWETRWADLRRDTGGASYDAIAALAAVPDQTLAQFRDRLSPAPAPDTQRIAALIQDTDSARYTVRQRASAELEQLGEEAEPYLLRAVHGPVSAETRSRAEKLLHRLAGTCLSGDPLRGVRAVEVLERIGTSEARRQLEALAQGAPDARLTTEAQAALRRLNVK